MQKHMTIVIWFTGTSALLVIAGALVLAFYGKAIPDPIWGLGGAAVGSLGTLLTGRLSFDVRSGDVLTTRPTSLRSDD